MTTRVLYQDVIPYDTPSSLESLKGPADGVLILPITVHWGPDATADLSPADGVEKAYENLVREGTRQQQEGFSMLPCSVRSGHNCACRNDAATCGRPAFPNWPPHDNDVRCRAAAHRRGAHPERDQRR